MKKFFALLLSAALTLSLAACGGGGGGASTPNPPSGSGSGVPVDSGLTTQITSTDKVTIRLAYDVAESHPSHTAFVEKFKNALETASSGNITVELYPNSSMGSLAENMESMRIGDLEMAALNDSVIGALVPEYNLVGLPFLWTSLDAAHEALDGDFGDYLSQKLADQAGILNLGWGDVGFRNITNSRKAISSPADMAGLKIRTMTNTLHVEYFTALGALPTPMSFSELFTALQQKTVDGQENPTALIYNNALHEAQSYMTVSEHVFTAINMNIAANFYNSLPEDVQKIFDEAAQEAAEYERTWTAEHEAEQLQAMKDNGMEVVETPDLESFQAAVQSVYDAYPQYADYITRIQEALA